MKTLMSGGIFHYLQSVQAYISPPIAAVFLFGLYFKWINAKGAIVSLWVGFAFGMLRLITEYLSKEGIIIITKGTFLEYLLAINFLHFAIVLFVFSTFILMLFSKLSKPQDPESLKLVTFQKSELKSKFKFSTDLILTIVLIILVLIIWAIFSPIGIAK